MQRLTATAVLVAALLLSFAAPAFAQNPTAGPNDSLAWDYTAAQLAAGVVTRFEVCLDSQPCVSVDLTAKVQGQESYTWKLPAVTIGNHVATVKACNTSLCSDAASLTFAVVIKPAPVGGLRIGG